MYAAINLVGMYNDHIISANTDRKLSSRETLVHRLQWALTTLSSVDVVLEMLAVTTRGRKGRWNMVSTRTPFTGAGMSCLNAGAPLLA